MDEMRLEVNEELMDAQGARIDDLERRFAVLLELLKEENVCKAVGLTPARLDRAKPSESPLKCRSARHSLLRSAALEEHRQQRIMERLSRVSPERLEELLRGR